jgi:hypothetical protein
MPLKLDLNAPAIYQPALTDLANRAHPIDFLLLNAGQVPGVERVLTAEGVEAAQATLSGHHRLTVGLLHPQVTNNLRRRTNDRKYLDNRSKCWAWERDCPAVRLETGNHEGDSFLQKSNESGGS